MKVLPTERTSIQDGLRKTIDYRGLRTRPNRLPEFSSLATEGFQM